MKASIRLTPLRYCLKGLAAVVCYLTAMTAPLWAQMTATHPLPSSTPDRSIHVTIDDIPIDELAISRLFQGIYDAAGADTGSEFLPRSAQPHLNYPAKVVDTITKSRSEMPASYQYFYYVGRDAKSNRELVWQARETPKGDANLMNDQFLAAYALAALDAGYVVGEPWKMLWELAPDRAARLALGKAIASAVSEAGDQKKAISAADAAWIRQHILVGMTRDSAYAALRSRGLVPYNSIYNPGVPVESANGLKGCDYSDQTAAAWPYHGEPVPKRAGDCAAFRIVPEAFPSARIELPGAFTIACGSELVVTIGFDNTDRVDAVKITKPQWSCM